MTARTGNQSSGHDRSIPRVTKSASISAWLERLQLRSDARNEENRRSALAFNQGLALSGSPLANADNSGIDEKKEGSK